MLIDLSRIVRLGFHDAFTAYDQRVPGKANSELLNRRDGAFRRGPEQFHFTLSSSTSALRPWKPRRRSATPSGDPYPRPRAKLEFPGRATISVECGTDAALLRSILESLR